MYRYSRRSCLLAASSLILSSACAKLPTGERDGSRAVAQIKALENSLAGRIGVFAWRAGDGLQLAYRADERFPFCSTFKVIAAAAILDKSTRDAGLMQQVIRYQPSDMVSYSPITEQRIGAGMSVAALCAAALQYSDNTAANLLIRLLGGPQAVTAYAASIGDSVFRLDRCETSLNTAIPEDPRDTTTPRAMGGSLQRLLLGDALPPVQRQQLQVWMLGNTTGAARIKAGLPADWRVADKTGSGSYGTANDIAVVWPPAREPIVMAIYTTLHSPDAEARSDVIAAVAQVIMGWLGA